MNRSARTRADDDVHIGNGSGWKVAAILAAIVCALLGVLSGAGAVYYNHLSWSGEKAGQIDKALESAALKIGVLRENQEDMHDTQVEMEKQIGKLARAVDRLADELCYTRSGKPCNHHKADEP